MSNKVELNLYFGDVRNVLSVSVLEENLKSALSMLRTGQGILETLSGLEVRTSQVTAFEVIR